MRRRENYRLNATGFRRLYPLQSQRFHALLNSLFKVLCNFPSRYLFAIGLVAIFSLTSGLRRIRAALSSNPTLSRSSPAQSVSAMGLAPAMGRGPNQGNSRSQSNTGEGLLNPTAPSSQRLRDSGWALSLSLAVTWDIAVAFFSSAY